MEKGWVRSYRSILDNGILMTDNNAYILFTKLLLIVDRETGEWRGGRRQLAAITNIKDRTIYDTLKRLQNNGMIKIKTTGLYSNLQIVNWGQYQTSERKRKVNVFDPTTSPTAKPTAPQQIKIEEAQPPIQPRIRKVNVSDPHGIQHYNKKEKEKENIKSHVNLDKPNTRMGSYKDLFGILVEKLGYTPSVLATPARINRLKIRLKTFTPKQITDAAEMILNDEYMQGSNPQGKRYGTIDYLLRSDEIIDKYLNSGQESFKKGEKIDVSKYA